MARTTSCGGITQFAGLVNLQSFVIMNRAGDDYRFFGSFGGKTSVLIKGENRRLFFWKAVNVKVQFSIKQKLCKLE